VKIHLVTFLWYGQHFDHSNDIWPSLDNKSLQTKWATQLTLTWIGLRQMFKNLSFSENRVKNDGDTMPMSKSRSASGSYNYASVRCVHEWTNFHISEKIVQFSQLHQKIFSFIDLFLKFLWGVYIYIYTHTHTHICLWESTCRQKILTKSKQTWIQECWHHTCRPNKIFTNNCL
jgi:hypothetical protein